MDAVEFIRERNRMCKHFHGCNKCPADGLMCSTIGDMHDAEKLVHVVEQWAKGHPHKTRQSEFLRQWPGAIVEDGVVPAVLAEGKRRGPGSGPERRIGMDAVEFIRERNRMCKHYRGCNGCPADGLICSNIWGMDDAEKLVQIVEEWAKEHTRKTRQSEFLRQWPGALVDTSGTLCIDPCNVDKQMKGEAYCEAQENCYGCRREFWGQEVE